MKRFLLPMIFLLVPTLVFSQGKDATEKNCFEKYNELFQKRGAFAIADGMHKKVMITKRKGEYTECVYGKARVEGGLVTDIYFMFKDDTYEHFDAKYKYTNRAPINNGVSEQLVTVDGYKINVIFLEKIKPKKKEMLKVPDLEFEKLNGGE
jgi:hypothetical protein